MTPRRLNRLAAGAVSAVVLAFLILLALARRW